MPHTPAPWNWNGTCLVAESTRDYPDGYAVAKVFNESDVALIAAAPAMLEALYVARQALAEVMQPHLVPGLRNEFDIIGAAIRAATGE